MKKIILSIDGMTCSACSNGLEKYLNKQDGIINASVNLVMANALITYDEKKLSKEQIEIFVKKAGFKSLGIFKEIKEDKIKKEEKIVFIIYTFLAIVVMYITMGHMVNLSIISIVDPHKFKLNYILCLVFISFLFIIYGFDIIKNGYKNLIHKTPNMDTLIGIGVIVSFVYSLYNSYLVVTYNNTLISNLYFESTCIVIYFVKLGRFLDRTNKNKTKDAIQKLVKITPENAIIKKDGILKNVTLDEIIKGDIIVCKPGEKIAVDGTIIEGTAHLDESFITGESIPKLKNKGDKVIAGSINYDGYIEYVAEKIGKESTISEIVRLVIEMSNTKAPIARIADKISGYFVPVVLIIAVITFLVLIILGNSLDSSILTFVTILVVACPCSLGLATPLAIIVSEGVCVKNGILIKKSEILENASKTNVVVFDKTGTLTYGKLRISEIINYSNINDEELLQIVGSIESKSAHPISRAFTQVLEDKKMEKLQVKEFGNVNGYGIIGKVNNKRLLIGNSKILESYNIINNHIEDENRIANKGNSIVYVVENEKIIALIGIKDIIKPDVIGAIDRLKNMKINTIMLTGDNEQVANIIANEININKVFSNVLPAEKAEVINELKKNNNFVMMCGDGINDSPALANADIGVSVKDGTDIAMDSADVILTNNDMNSLISLIQISKRTIKIIKQNLFWAFFYNSLMIPIAMGLFKPLGITITPMIASFSMIISSLTVVLNTLRLRK